MPTVSEIMQKGEMSAMEMVKMTQEVRLVQLKSKVDGITKRGVKSDFSEGYR